MMWTDVMLKELGRIELFGAPFNYLEKVEERELERLRSNPRRRLGAAETAIEQNVQPKTRV
jgi:hypothetical protein